MDKETEIEGQATETETEVEGTGSDQTKNAKTFTQEELNKVVAKEKAAWKRQSEKAGADHETIVEGLRRDIQARDEVIAKQVDLLKQDLELDEDYLELLSTLDPLEQFARLAKKIEKAGKQEMPRTPPSQTKGRAGQPIQRINTI